MAAANNTTCACGSSDIGFPNAWQHLFFVPSFLQQHGGFQQGFQLDIVGFLAILGEGSVESTAQVATLSTFSFLPRLIPAPQTFIRPARAEKLEPHSEARVVGIHSGNSSENIHHIAHALHRGEKLEANVVRCVRVTENTDKPWPSIVRMGPLAYLALGGFTLSCMLFAMGMYFQDGMAVVAVIFLSSLSTCTGLANKWRHIPSLPRPDPNSPPADVVIKYPQGAFIVVKCEETTARYLYFDKSERCAYLIRSTTMYRVLSLISTLLLMGGVISLANSTTYVQVGFAGAYILMNVFYWIVAALPPSYHWDLSRLRVEEIQVKGGAPPRTSVIQHENPTYTAALWKAIAVTGSKDWVREANWAPKTQVWDDWLQEAEDAARGEPMKISKGMGDDGREVEIWTIRNWDYKNVLSTLLKSRTATNISKVV